ncbi:FUSC family protein [Streptomyces sp. VRA16 Mangrove soil]|uniref:FUSC family protein n=1 Tax=Streptomyces sp. VRA16 Mangrove soil TaxID=2817434 RepID=UPI001A9DEBDD|nr:FUSC family protein [Streptomyces sp. VRA16 Mangrove soil]MBO1332861.1 FUSC family protein [Streptomyces sp. VRA16 Mangrove soil]
MTTPGTLPDLSTSNEPAGAGLAPHRVAGPRRWWDGVLAADPGLGQHQSGWRALVAMVTSLAVGYWMAEALAIPDMIGMMVAGMMGLMSAFAVAENTWDRLARAILWMPFPYSAVLWVCATLDGHRTAQMVLMVAALALTFLLARFGPFALVTGMMLFNGLMVGMLAGIPAALVGKTFAVALVAAAAVLLTRLLLCFPMPREDLLRTQRAFVVEARRVADAAVEALDPDADQQRAVRRMTRALRRLNITTVTIDGRLAQPEVAADPVVAELLHRHLFDAELALRGIGQAAADLTRLPVPAPLREALAVGLALARDTPLGRAEGLRPAAAHIQERAEAILRDPAAPADDVEAAVLARRVGDLLDTLADALRNWLELGRRSCASAADVPFQPTVALENNRLPGSAGPARRVLAAGTESGWRRAVPYIRVPVHAAIAAAVVCPIADAIDPRRFYWGLVGVMITLFGTNTTHERLRKFAHRMIGTALGAVLGIALLHLVGRDHVYATLAVIVAGLAFGAWGMQRAYACWVVGLVVALTQLYGMTTPDSGMDHLLGERILDNGIGVLVATACAALIFPLSRRTVVREAERGYVDALAQVIRQVEQRWDGPEAPVRLRGAARAVDAALLQVQGIARPLVRMPVGVRGPAAEHRVALLATATGHARTLAAAADIDVDLPPRLAERARLVTETLVASLRELDRCYATGEPEGAWRRVSPLVRELETELAPAAPGPRADRLRTALRELAALDETMAAYAEQVGLPVAAPGRAAPAAASPMQRTTRAVMAAWGEPHGRGRTTATARLTGTVHCDTHPEGCPAWITVISARGKRLAKSQAHHGSYTVDGLPAGIHTLVVSAARHAPRAELVTVDPASGTVRHDIAAAR